MGCFQSKATIPPSDEPEPLPDKADLGTSTNRNSPLSLSGVSFSVLDFILFLFFVFCFQANGDGTGGDQDKVPAFKEYGLVELRAATKGFSTDLIVSESGEKAPNVVYRGRLDGGRLIAVKRFSKQSWPDPQQFVVSKDDTGWNGGKNEGAFFWFAFWVFFSICPTVVYYNWSHSIKGG